jgi:hypothetical protein
MKQFLIAIDQLINTVTYAHNEGFGYADESLSARMWRLREHSKFWRFARNVTDTFFHLVFKQEHHCYHSFLSEYEKHQLPESYRQAIVDYPEWFQH